MQVFFLFPNIQSSNKLQYFGTMAGVRGFADPNAHVSQDGKQVWFQ